MAKPVKAKTIVSTVKQDGWFGLKYNMNLYRGCQHNCIYCDSRSSCYGIEDFEEIQYKENALELLDKELKGKRVKGTIGTGSMHDPYMPVEKELQLTRGALEIIKRRGFSVHVLTKSTLVLMRPWSIPWKRCWSRRRCLPQTNCNAATIGTIRFSLPRNMQSMY